MPFQSRPRHFICAVTRVGVPAELTWTVQQPSVSLGAYLYGVSCSWCAGMQEFSSCAKKESVYSL